MQEDRRELLNRIYRPLDTKRRELFSKLAELYGEFQINSGFYNGHYHKNAEGLYQADAYPIPVIGVAGLCDIELDIEGITVTTKLSKHQIGTLEWDTLGDIPFEVYGVEDYLLDFGTRQSVDQLKSAAMDSGEKEFFISFSMPASSGGDEIIQLLKRLQESCFYYQRTPGMICVCF